MPLVGSNALVRRFLRTFNLSNSLCAFAHGEISKLKISSKISRTNELAGKFLRLANFNCTLHLLYAAAGLKFTMHQNFHYQRVGAEVFASFRHSEFLGMLLTLSNSLASNFTKKYPPPIN